MLKFFNIWRGNLKFIDEGFRDIEIATTTHTGGLKTNNFSGIHGFLIFCKEVKKIISMFSNLAFISTDE